MHLVTACGAIHQDIGPVRIPALLVRGDVTTISSHWGAEELGFLLLLWSFL